MPFTKADHIAWQNNPDARRCVLVVLQAYTGAGTDFFYLSNRPFSSASTDTFPSITFDNRLSGDVRLRYGVPFFKSGRIDCGIGDIEIDNNDGGLDAWRGYSWAGRDVYVLWGEPDWPLDNFLVAPVLRGTIESMAFGGDVLTVRVFDRTGVLDRPVQDNVYTEGEHAGRPKPLCYGQVYNISPPCIDTINRVYQVHDGIIEGVDAVYDNGVLLTVTTDYTVDANAGTFTLTGAPVGTVTADIKGAKPSGVWLQTIGTIAKDLTTNRGDSARRLNPATEIDTAAFTALDAALPHSIGLWIDADRINVLDVLDGLFSPLGAGYYFDGDVLTVGVLSDPSAESPTDIIDDLLIVDGGFSFSPLNMPQWRTRIGHEKNWTIQTPDQLAPSITDPNAPTLSVVSWLGQEFRINIASDASVKTTHARAVDADTINTPISGDARRHWADGTVADWADSSGYYWALDSSSFEAERQQGILGSQRWRVLMDTEGAPFKFMPFDFIEIQDYAYGYSSGVKAQILTVDKSLTSGELTIEAWH